jgi:hypothetical protein
MLPGYHWVLERLVELVREKWAEEANNRRQHALNVFHRALNETEIYYGTLRELGKDREREEELSRLWRDASEELVAVDRDLAERCRTKSSYWADPHGWTLESLEKAHIAIHEMREAATQLLAKENARRNRVNS